MGTWLDGNKISWTYTDSAGGTWRRAAEKAITDQVTVAAVTVGGAAAATSVVAMSKSKLRPRGVYCTASGKPTKFVVCYAPDAPLLTPGTTINLNTGTTSVEYTSSADWLPERKIRSWGIKQST